MKKYVKLLKIRSNQAFFLALSVKDARKCEDDPDVGNLQVHFRSIIKNTNWKLGNVIFDGRNDDCVTVHKIIAGLAKTDPNKLFK